MSNILAKFRTLPYSKLFMYLLIFSIPIQTRKIFFTEFSYYFSYHAFHNTMFIYLTDLLFFGVIIFWLLESRKTGFILHKIYTRIAQDKIYSTLAVFWLILAASLLISREIFLSQYGLLKFTEFFLIFAYIRERISISREMNRILWLILAASWIQSILAIWQYVFQRSVGFGLIGEEFVRQGLPGVAEFFSRETINPLFYDFFPYFSPISEVIPVIRAYGTTPHPNVLAGFLFVALISTIYLLFQTFHRNISPKYISSERNIIKSNISREMYVKVVVLSLSTILTSTALILTFSRFIWLGALLGVISMIFYGFRRFHPEPEQVRFRAGVKSSVYIVVILLVSLFINWFAFGGAIKARVFELDRIGEAVASYGTTESIEQRQLFNSIAVKMMKQSPLLGVGLKNYVYRMDDFVGERLLPFQHQPAHNIYLLVGAEVGIIGGLVFIWLLYNIVRHAWRQKKEPHARFLVLTLVFGLLALGLVDHYLLTIQQGSLLFWTVLGLAVAKR